MSYTHASFFSGIGGLDIAAHRAGFETIQACEINPASRAIYSRNFPGIPVHDDIRTFSALPLRGRIHVASAGFPCQDISAANSKAVGIGGRRSGLVGEFLRIVGECGPDWLLLENSDRLRIRGGDWLLDQLAGLGYKSLATVVSAGDVGAPHIRPRAFVLAHAHDLGGDPSCAARYARELASDGRRFGPSSERGWLDVVLRPGAVPAFTRRDAGSVVSEPVLLRSLDGISGAVDRNKALGNAVVPDQAFPFFCTIAGFLRAEEGLTLTLPQIPVRRQGR